MKDEWHLSKSIPTSFFLAIFAQTITVIWFLAALRNDVDNNTSQLIRHDTRIEATEDGMQNQAVMLARIDENLKVIRDAVEQSRREQR